MSGQQTGETDYRFGTTDQRQRPKSFATVSTFDPRYGDSSKGGGRRMKYKSTRRRGKTNRRRVKTHRRRHRKH